MLKRTLFIAAVALAWGGALQATTVKQLEPAPEHAFSAGLITKIIDRYHYRKLPLDDAQSELILERYLESLDANRSFFTQRDVDEFAIYARQLDDALKDGRLSPAFEIFKRFNQRREERADYAIKLLSSKFDFSKAENYRFDRTESPWAKDRAELDEIWRKRVKNDVLSLRLAKKAEDEIADTLKKRYERMKKLGHQFKAEDVYELFINAYLRTIEPHTGYFSPRSTENFKINMRLSLEGIGAVLQTIDDHTVVQRIITGGPADLGGQLFAEDRIVGVAQGEDGKMEDVVGWRIGDVVDLIRGPKGSTVRLQILPKSSGVDGASKEIKIVRNKVDLEKQQVQQSVIEIPEGEQTTRIGVITIPTFYMDFDAAARGEDDYRSTTRDTRVALEELKQQNVSGIIIDLRGDGGGSLSEAISLTGLFIESGPVVMVKENTGRIKVNEDEDDSIAYAGPLAVLVDRYSASASEIFSGAIQDYGRGIVLGEATFGKGTVQTIQDLNRYARDRSQTLGQLKLTMAQFFRVNGESTQHRGVIPDIQFPGAERSEKEGERAFDNALPWAKIDAAKFKPYNQLTFDLGEIRARHQQRVNSDLGFQFLLTQRNERHDLMEEKTINLQEKERKAEREQQEVEQNDRLNQFRLSRGMISYEESEKLIEKAKREDTEKLSEEIDKIELREAAAILLDVIDTAGVDKVTVKADEGKGFFGSLLAW